jgi:type II secretory pathway pseudopilin PulG
MIEVALGTLLIGMLLFAAAVVTRAATQRRSTGAAAFAADLFRQTLEQYLNNNLAWQNMVNDSSNASLTCLQSTTSSCTGAGGAFRVDDAGAPASVIYDPRTAGSGFAPSGLCATFHASPAAGNDSCPLHFDLSWAPVCWGATCANPQVQITGTLIYNPETESSALNPANYGFVVVRPAVCPAGQVQVGFDPVSGPTCVPVAAGGGGPRGVLCGGHRIGIGAPILCAGFAPGQGLSSTYMVCPPGYLETSSYGWGVLASPQAGFDTCVMQ